MYPATNPEITGNRTDANAPGADISERVSCLLCRVEFRSASHLLTHVAAAHKPCSCCVFCRALLYTRGEFDTHMEFEKEHPIRCRRCKAAARSVADLEAHIDIKHGQLDCSVCGAPSLNGDELKQHVQLLHECPECKTNLWNSRAVERHLADVHGMTCASEKFIELPNTRLAYLPGRLPVTPPDSPEERCRWLYPFCKGLLAAKKMGDYLADPPAEFRDRLPYVLKHSARVNKAKDMGRFKRLKGGLPPKAACLARVLAQTEYSPSYADRLLAKLTPDMLEAFGKK